MDGWTRLGHFLKETQILGSIQSVLYWDQNTSMPVSGSSWRGEQLSLMARQLHARQTSSEYLDLISQAREEFEISRDNGDHDCERERNLELLELQLARQTSLDSVLVGELANAKSEGYERWQKAKSKSEFSIFSPALKKLISLRQEEARQLSEKRSCWETLAQPFEPDICLDRLKELFSTLRTELPIILSEVCLINRNISSTNWDLTSASQERLGNQLLDEWGRNREQTSLAFSPHPFSITLGPRDYRLTRRVVEGQPFSCFLATAHEWGHSLYEQGLPDLSHQWFAWPLGQATSMAVHESQSLFWENRVARSKVFAQRWWSRFAKEGAPVYSANQLWKEINPLTPGLNRVEADELTYGIHILIRTDLEIALLEQGLEVDDLPAEWNKMYSDMLGIVPKNDAEGCLQDVHWSEGMFGYFPSYLLGHLISAQIAEAMCQDFESQGIKGPDPIADLISKGKESTIIDWLRRNVHVHGRKVNAEQLVERVSGKSLSSDPFMSYLKQKILDLQSCL